MPFLGAGGVAHPEDAGEAIRAGAEGVAVGTVLLRTDEAGTSTPHRDALADPGRHRTVVTRAFTGRPTRALRNEFTDRYSAITRSGCPALHHLTSPVRRAATRAGDPERVHLWAGTGYRATTAEPAARVLARLASRL